MKGPELAASLRRLADVVQHYDRLPKIEAGLSEEDQPGAAGMLLYLRDLMTITPKETFTRDEILVLLNAIEGDREIFSMDLIAAFEIGEDEQS